jgi:hypothetical protein
LSLKGTIRILTQNGKMKILLSEFHPRLNLTAFLFSTIGVQKQHKILRIQVPKGTKGFFFWDFGKERFSWPKKWFYRVQKVNLVEKSVV